MSSSLMMGSDPGGTGSDISDSDSWSSSYSTRSSSRSRMSPASIAFMGVGTYMGGMAKAKSDTDQALAESQNADFYRLEAAFAQTTGDRQLQLFDRQAKVTYGEQESAFAKAGVDTSESSHYLAQQRVFGAQQEGAITEETDMNVYLASARARQAEVEAANLNNASQTDQTNAVIGTVATLAMFL